MAKIQKELDGWKTCSECDKTYLNNTDNFYKTGAGYLYSFCKDCFRIKQLEYKSRKQLNPAKESNRGRRKILPDEDGNLTCRACKTLLPATTENFYKIKDRYIAECKPCRLEYERERYVKNKVIDLRRKLLQKAAETKEELSQCLRCNQLAPISSFVEYDTNVYANGKILLTGYKYICGVCWQMLYDATFALIPAAYEMHKKRVGYVHKRKSRKSNTTKIS